jgi:hypothetical protein
MPKMKQEICLRQFEPGGRAQKTMQRGFVELRGCGGILSPQTVSPQSTHFCHKYIKDKYNLVIGTGAYPGPRRFVNRGRCAPAGTHHSVCYKFLPFGFLYQVAVIEVILAL